MLKEMLASSAAKLFAACVCPVVATGVALKVPPVRQALHKATAPEKPRREARAKPRAARKKAPIPKKAAPELDAPPQAALMCAQPMLLSDARLQPVSLAPQPPPVPDLLIQAPGPQGGGDCGAVRLVGGGNASMSFAAVPEPAIWAQLVAGFGLAGGAVRAGRRRAATARRA